MRKILSLLILACLASQWLAAASLAVPRSVQAGQELSIPTSGNGDATLYLFGPSYVAKRSVKLGMPVKLATDELATAGRYIVILNGESSTFFVTSAAVSSAAFIARPSRVPAATKNVVSGTVFLFDRNQNLVLSPQHVDFSLAVPGAPDVRRTESSRDGIAWTQLDSGRRAGAAQFVASSGPASVRRVVQEVASEPCSIRMRAARGSNGAIMVETDPIRDCAGNPVPDGTIVTFTSVEENGRSTVDARIKRGFAQAELPPSPRATISVAAGVVVGNEIHWGGGQ